MPRKPSVPEWVITAAAIASVGVWAGIFAWNLPGTPVREVSINALWSEPQSYHGKHVLVVGRVRVFLPGTPKEHYGLESSDVFRVGLEGISPAKLKALRGIRVSAEGSFFYDKTRGGHLLSPALKPLE